MEKIYTLLLLTIFLNCLTAQTSSKGKHGPMQPTEVAIKSPSSSCVVRTVVSCGNISIICSARNSTDVVVRISNASGSIVYAASSKTYGGVYHTTLEFKRSPRGKYLVEVIAEGTRHADSILLN